MNLSHIEKEFSDIKLKVLDFETVSDGFFNYNLIDIEFTADTELDVFGTPQTELVIQETIKVKHGSNVKRAIENKLENYFKDESL